MGGGMRKLVVQSFQKHLIDDEEAQLLCVSFQWDLCLMFMMMEERKEATANR